jgi:hypothetical protein
MVQNTKQNVLAVVIIQFYFWFGPFSAAVMYMKKWLQIGGMENVMALYYTTLVFLNT